MGSGGIWKFFRRRRRRRRRRRCRRRRRRRPPQNRFLVKNVKTKCASKNRVVFFGIGF